MKDSKKWTKSKIFLVVFNSLLCVAIVVSAMVIIIDKSRTKNGVIYDGKVETTASEEKENSESTKSGKATARLMCAGDNLIHRSIYKQAKERSKNGTYDFDYAYDQIRDIIPMSDIAFLNQEVLIDPGTEPDTYPCFNSPPELLDEMIGLGFDVFNQATNHCLDKGVTAARRDISLFKSKQNIILTGLYDNEDDMLKPQTTDVNGITFSFVGFTEYTNGIPIPSDSNLGLLAFSDERYTEEQHYAKAKQMIDIAKQNSDIVCVSMHWAVEDTTTPHDDQKKILTKLLEYGADLIIGTGPHVLQPIEFMQNGDGEQAAVIWSLGNLISCQAKTDNLLGGIADVMIEKDFATNKTSVTSCKLIPTITQYNSGYTNVHIVPFCNYNEQLCSENGVSSSNFTMEYINNFYKNMYGDKLEINYKQ